MNNIPESFMLTERGVRQPANHCPHNMAFPAMMSALKTFLGLESRVSEYNGYMNDYDYFFQMAVSTEGFGLFQHYERESLMLGKWNSQPLEDCFLSEGINFRLVADDSVAIKDEVLNSDTIRDEILLHLASDLPVILIRKKGGNYSPLKLVVGYEDNGDTLLTHDGHTGIMISANSTPYHDWVDSFYAVIFIDGICEPLDRKDVILRTLKIAYEMLTETNETYGEYGYGEYMWDKWISRLNNDRIYKSNILKYISPEKFDMAERRAYTIYFFKEAEEYSIFLKDASDAFDEIHNNMWKIHNLVNGHSKTKPLARSTRDTIVEIAKYCKTLDKKAADNIKSVLDSLYAPRDTRVITVIDKNSIVKNSTYLRRAKGLVKKERAEWVNENTIQLKD